MNLNFAYRIVECPNDIDIVILILFVIFTFS